MSALFETYKITHVKRPFCPALNLIEVEVVF